MRSYAWSDGEIEAYKKYREKEELELLGVIDASLKAAMDAMSDDLEKYLAEAGEEEFKKKAEEKKGKKEDKRTPIQKFLGMRTVKSKEQSGNVAEPFIAIFMGFGEILGAFLPSAVEKSKSPGKSDGDTSGKDASEKLLRLWTGYKKTHQLLTW
jgi:VIT1/CCC1 family predicted Fe2+/Mn2+ transporter